MVLLGYNHLTTITTTDALAPLNFPKLTATYITLIGISVSWNICYKFYVLYCDAINYMAHRFFYLGWHGGCWWPGTCLLHNADIGWSMNAGSSQDNVN